MMCGQLQCAFSATFSFGLKTKTLSALISHFLLIFGVVFKAVQWPVSSQYEKFLPKLDFALELGLFMSLWGIAAKPSKAQSVLGQNIVPWQTAWGLQGSEPPGIWASRGAGLPWDIVGSCRSPGLCTQEISTFTLPVVTRKCNLGNGQIALSL